MNSLAYTINSLAWSLVGVALTLTYQKVANWYRKRQNRGELPPITTAAYFGTLLVLFGIVSSLFTYSQSLARQRDLACQGQVNRNNVAVSNNRQENLVGLADSLSDIISKDKFSKQQVVNILNGFVSQAKGTGNSVPVTDCKNGELPPNFKNNSPNPTPNPSPSTTGR